MHNDPSLKIPCNMFDNEDENFLIDGMAYYIKASIFRQYKRAEIQK